MLQFIDKQVTVSDMWIYIFEQALRSYMYIWTYVFFEISTVFTGWSRVSFKYKSIDDQQRLYQVCVYARADLSNLVICLNHVWRYMLLWHSLVYWDTTYRMSQGSVCRQKRKPNAHSCNPIGSFTCHLWEIWRLYC